MVRRKIVEKVRDELRALQLGCVTVIYELISTRTYGRWRLDYSTIVVRREIVEKVRYELLALHLGCVTVIY